MSDITCKYCGEPFENKGKLMVHYRQGCPKQGETPPAELPGKPVIPFSVLPDEIRVLGPGRLVGLRIQGRLTEDGVEIDQADLIR